LGCHDGLPRWREPVSFCVLISKNQAFPAIRAPVNARITGEMAVFGHFGGFPRVFRVKAVYFTFVKKHLLKAGPPAFRNSFPDANPR
jgi:hypothetical protein